MLLFRNSVIAIATLLSITVSGFAQNETIKTTNFEVNLHCEECKNKIVQNFYNTDGIKSIEVSLPDQCVRISYNAIKNTDSELIKGFEALGYTANVKNENSYTDCGCDDKCFTSKRKRLLFNQ